MFIPIRQHFDDAAHSDNSCGGCVATARVTAVTPCCGKPLASVAIHVEGKEAGTTGPDGVVDLPLSAGRHTLTAPGHSFGTKMSVEVLAGKVGVQDVRLVSSGELFLFLADFSFEDDVKDGIMLCTNKGNIPDEAGIFAGTAEAPGSSGPEGMGVTPSTTTYTPALCLNEGASCVDVLRNLKIQDVDGRTFSANDDLVEWFEVFADDCPLAVLSSATPLRLGYFLGKRETRLGGVLPNGRNRSPRISAEPPKMTPATWDVRGRTVRLPKLSRTGMWRPSRAGRPLHGPTLPEASLQKPRSRPSKGALGELDYRLYSLGKIYATEEKPRPPASSATAPPLSRAFAERLAELSRPKQLAAPVEPVISASVPSLLPRRRRPLSLPGAHVPERTQRAGGHASPSPAASSRSVPQLPRASPKAKRGAGGAESGASSPKAKGAAAPARSSPSGNAGSGGPSPGADGADAADASGGEGRVSPGRPLELEGEGAGAPPTAPERPEADGEPDSSEAAEAADGKAAPPSGGAAEAEDESAEPAPAPAGAANANADADADGGAADAAEGAEGAAATAAAEEDEGDADAFETSVAGAAAEPAAAAGEEEDGDNADEDGFEMESPTAQSAGAGAGAGDDELQRQASKGSEQFEDDDGSPQASGNAQRTESKESDQFEDDGGSPPAAKADMTLESGAGDDFEDESFASPTSAKREGEGEGEAPQKAGDDDDFEDDESQAGNTASFASPASPTGNDDDFEQDSGSEAASPQGRHEDAPASDREDSEFED